MEITVLPLASSATSKIMRELLFSHFRDITCSVPIVQPGAQGWDSRGPNALFCVDPPGSVHAWAILSFVFQIGGLNPQHQPSERRLLLSDSSP